MVEAFNKTLTHKIFKYFTYMNTRNWLDILPEFLTGYNHSVHSSIKMAPSDVNIENEFPLWYKTETSNQYLDVVKYNIGDHVRISRVKGTFEKGYLPRWSEEVFKIVRIIKGIKTQYKLSDYNDEEIDGSFYNEELQVVDKPEVYRIEKVLESKKVGRVKQYLVKWLGYPKQFNSWVIENELQQLNR